MNTFAFVALILIGVFQGSGKKGDPASHFGDGGAVPTEDDGHSAPCPPTE